MLACEFYITNIFPQIKNDFPFLCLFVEENFIVCNFKFVFVGQLLFLGSWWKVMKISFFILRWEQPSTLHFLSSWDFFVWSTSRGSLFIFASHQSHASDWPVIYVTSCTICQTVLCWTPMSVLWWSIPEMNTLPFTYTSYLWNKTIMFY